MELIRCEPAPGRRRRRRQRQLPRRAAQQRQVTASRQRLAPSEARKALFHCASMSMPSTGASRAVPGRRGRWRVMSCRAPAMASRPTRLGMTADCRRQTARTSREARHQDRISQQVAAARRDGMTAGVLFTDLDDFKVATG
jgi:hypothetical protein